MSHAAPRRLSLLAPHEDALQRCAYCPKLCRAACPVSEAEGNESLIPWGKMSTAWFLSRGDVPMREDHASLAWACTGCRACKERCDHRNEVATVLGEARAEAFAAGVAPEAAAAVARGFEGVEVEATAAASALEAALPPGPSGRRVGVVIGCSYLRHLPDVARDALAATRALLGDEASVRPLGGCCGLPLLEAGDRAGFERAARRFAARLAEVDEVVAVDPGCAHALSSEYPRLGIEAPSPRLFVDLAAEAAPRLARWSGADPSAPPRYADPCRLGRGLGRFDEPRRALAAVAGAAPRELDRHGPAAECSGGGGLLPLTRPAASRAIAEARVGEHRDGGGGTLVTACASSLRRYRSAGEPAEDLATWVARGLGVDGG